MSHTRPPVPLSHGAMSTYWFVAESKAATFETLSMDRAPALLNLGELAAHPHGRADLIDRSDAPVDHERLSWRQGRSAS